MSITDDLITDRTNDDLKDENNRRGGYDYIDYNRVNNAVSDLASGLGITYLTIKNDFTRSYIPNDSDMTTYRGNIKYLANAVTLDNINLPTNNANILTITGANQIEQTLKRVDSELETYGDRYMRWEDIDALNETWTQLSNKNKKWDTRFLK